MKVLLATLLALLALAARAQTNALATLTSTNGVTLAVHDLVPSFYTNSVLVYEQQVMRVSVNELVRQVTTVNGQRRTNVVYSGTRTNWLETNVVRRAWTQQPGWPPPPISNATTRP